MNSFQPKGYSSLFFIFMFERFYYYGIRSLLFLFMMKYLLFTTEKVETFSVFYLWSISLLPILGGFMSDLWLGQNRALKWSVIAMILGCFLFTVSALMGSSFIFYIALFFTAIGGMLFKPAGYTTLSNLYNTGNDPRRDSGFTLIFVAISLGALLAPLICGYLGEVIGWWLGFLIAGIFVIPILFLLKQLPTIMSSKESISKTNNKNAFLTMLVILLVVYIPVYLGNASTEKTIFTQISIYNFTIPSSWIKGFGSLLTSIFYLIFPWIWIRLAEKDKEPSSVYKFLLGMIFLIIGLGSYNFIASRYQESEIISLSTIGIMTVFLSLSEIFIAPIITSFITRIAPKKWAMTFVGTWFTLIGSISILISFGSDFLSNLTPIIIIVLIACCAIFLLLLRKMFIRSV